MQCRVACSSTSASSAAISPRATCCNNASSVWPHNETMWLCVPLIIIMVSVNAHLADVDAACDASMDTCGECAGVFMMMETKIGEMVGADAGERSSTIRGCRQVAPSTPGGAQQAPRHRAGARVASGLHSVVHAGLAYVLSARLMA